MNDTATHSGMTAESFTYLPYDFDEGAGVLTLNYEMGDYTFQEVIEFGPAQNEISAEHKTALHTAFEAISLMAGISYYKAALPPALTSDIPMDEAQAAFFHEVYFQGLGELMARNTLDMAALKKQMVFPNTGVTKTPQPLDLPNRAAVMIGGGKDSLVSIECLRKADMPMTLLAVNPSKPIQECIAASGLPAITIKRALDAQLFELNKQGAINGHVPITGILSFIAVAAAIWHGMDAVILSNERSANEATATYQGMEVNHQYSKSYEFERAMADYIRDFITPSLHYFSLLRPLSELRIAKMFAEESRYDEVFTSCNRTHKIHDVQEARWCGACPKCHFTSLMLATAMPLSRLESIFGRNILDDKNQLEGFRALCGLTQQKPWECVGEVEEAAAAIWYLSTQDEYKNLFIINALKDEITLKHKDLKSTYTAYFMPSETHNLPAPYLKALRDALN